VTRLLEHQGKELLRRFKIPTPEGRIVGSLEEAHEAARQIGYPLLVKAQVYTGKRGKSGGVRPAENEAELETAVREMLSTPIRGLLVESLLIEQLIPLRRELYVAVTADPSLRQPVLIFCANGGVDIEETFHDRPETVLRLPVDILRGVYLYDALNLLRDAPELSSRDRLEVAQVLCRLYELYRACDAKLAEINPLALTDNGPVALDARIDIDGDALGRHPELSLALAEEAGERHPTRLEQIAATIDQGDHRGTVHFVQIDPDLSYARQHQKVPIGFDCVGAGVSLTMMDELVPLGFYPVNFCDSSGNPVASKLYRITRVIFSQPGIAGYVFVSCVSSQQLDNTARGIIKAFKELFPQTGGQPDIPTVLAFRGAWDEEAIRLLADHGISAGRWVRVLGREATEQEVAETFQALHSAWVAERGEAA